MESGFRAIIRDTIMMVNKKYQERFHTRQTYRAPHQQNDDACEWPRQPGDCRPAKNQRNDQGHQRFQQQFRIAVAQQVMRFKQQT